MAAIDGVRSMVRRTGANRGPEQPGVRDASFSGAVWRRTGTLLGLSLAAALAAGCDTEDVGAPCVPEEEYNPEFSGFSADGANVESRSFQCKSRLCLVNMFQGRVSCPYGQDEVPGRCETPDGIAVEVPVAAQLVERPPIDAVYCSCRCDGKDPDVPYCDCPDGFACREVVPDIPVASEQLTGSYCIKEGTEVEPFELSIDACDPQTESCGPL